MVVCLGLSGILFGAVRPMRRGAGREREGPRPISFSRGLVKPYHIQKTVMFDSNLRI